MESSPDEKRGGGGNGVAANLDMEQTVNSVMRQIRSTRSWRTEMNHSRINAVEYLWKAHSPENWSSQQVMQRSKHIESIRRKKEKYDQLVTGWYTPYSQSLENTLTKCQQYREWWYKWVSKIDNQ